MKMTYHYSNGKSFTTPRCTNISITSKFIRTSHSIDDETKIPALNQIIVNDFAIGVRSVSINPDDFWSCPERIVTIDLKKVQIDRIDIKIYQLEESYEHLLDQAVDAGWRVNMRKMHNRETGYNIHITLTKPTL